MIRVNKLFVIFIGSFLWLLTPTITFSGEVSSRTIINPDGSSKATFYIYQDQEIAIRECDKEGNVIKLTGRVSDGIVKEYSPSGKLHWQVNFVNNEPEGIMKFYNEEGQVMGEIEMKDGKPGPYKVLIQDTSCKDDECKNTKSEATTKESGVRAEDK